MMDNRCHPSSELPRGEESQRHGGGIRNRWRSARERERMQARFQIQERMRAVPAAAASAPPPPSIEKAIDPTASRNHVQKNATDLSQPVVGVHGTRTTTRTETSTTSTMTHGTTVLAMNDPDHSLSLPSRSIEILQEALQRIGKNNVSYFSLSYLNQHLDLFDRPFPVQDVLWWTPPPLPEEEVEGDGSTVTQHVVVVRRLVSEPQLLSRWGEEKLRRFKNDFIATLYSCTLLEWTVWTERDDILPALLLGGLDVTRHGTRRTEIATTTTTIIDATALSSSAMEQQQQEQERQPDGQQLGKRFFQLQAPCSLKAYLVKRVHELRKKTLMKRWEEDDDGVSVCQKCPAETTPPPSSRRDDGGRTSLLQFEPCHHVLCTNCVWTDIVDHCAVSRWHLADIFVCPVCHDNDGGDDDDDRSSETAATTTTTILASRRATAQLRRAETMAKFQALPLSVDKSVEKKRSRRKSPCSSSWASAVNAGSTQSIRTEKFFKALDTMTMMMTVSNRNANNEAAGAATASYSFLWHYLQQGVNVDGRGEYGETGLWLAVWKGQERLVRLLLEYGSDPHAAAHGNVSCVRLARALGHTAILNLLLQMGGDEEGDDDHEDTATASFVTNYASSILLNYSHDTLIDVRTDHAGAGSYIFDAFLPDVTIDALIRLRERIPVAPSIKSADKPCSIRGYYCDALGIIVNPLSKLLVDAFGTDNVKVFRYMRFLFYKDEGVELAPHVDLSRADPDTGLRSTHSFLLYLTTCDAGGETALLQGLPQCERNIVLARVQPVRGRLLIFPHLCPHKGFAVIDVPKLLIRGEVYIPEGYEPTR